MQIYSMKDNNLRYGTHVNSSNFIIWWIRDKWITKKVFKKKIYMWGWKSRITSMALKRFMMEPIAPTCKIYYVILNYWVQPLGIACIFFPNHLRKLNWKNVGLQKKIHMRQNAKTFEYAIQMMQAQVYTLPYPLYELWVSLTLETHSIELDLW